MTALSTPAWLQDVVFNDAGLIPAIAQDHATGEILMMAWMSAESLMLTAQTKTAVYFSRSRGKLWRKGETSGHTQAVHGIYLDCDGDCLVLSVTQQGSIACHTGRASCFYRQLKASEDGATQWQSVLPVLKDPEAIYGESSGDELNVEKLRQVYDQASIAAQSSTSSKPQVSEHNGILNALDAVLTERKNANADSSYVASLYAKGINKILEKVGEEAVEAVIAAKDLAMADANNENATSQRQDLIYEVADVWFHTMVTLAWFNIGSDAVLNELARRFGLSGIDEKNRRGSSQ